MMERLDVYLVKRKDFNNRSQVLRAIKEKRVLIDGQFASKAGEFVSDKNLIEVIKPKHVFVSRGGEKLQGAVDDFNLKLNGVVALDIGSSTGGFCDCLLQNGAEKVIAVDVGSNQLHPDLRKNNKIILFENTDFREFVLPKGVEPTFACGDLSFISLEKIIPHLSVFDSIKNVVLLVKPQFECGKEVASKNHGIVKDFKEHKKAIDKVLNCLIVNKFKICGIVPSCIVGGSGNIEYLVYATKQDVDNEKVVAGYVNEAINKAKQIFKKGA